MSALFDAYIAVDWSASSMPKRGPDSVWYCVDGRAPENPSTRDEATDRLRGLLHDARRDGKRVLIGFDFPYGYPSGFADDAAPGTGPPWRRTWNLLASKIRDGASNANNRFEVAAELNGDSAVEACRQWTDLAPNDPAAHDELGTALRTINRDEEGLAEFLIAALIDPLDAAAHLNIGQIHLAAERYGEAASAFQHAVDAQPDHAAARYGLATALLRAGNEAEGTRQMEVARRLQADAMAASRRAYELNLLKIEAALRSQETRPGEAAGLWQRIVDLEPDVAANAVGLGEALARAGRHEQAATAFTRAIAIADKPELHRRLAEEYAQSGRPDESAREQATLEQMRRERLRRLGRSR